MGKMKLYEILHCQKYGKDESDVKKAPRHIIPVLVKEDPKKEKEEEEEQLPPKEIQKRKREREAHTQEDQDHPHHLTSVLLRTHKTRSFSGPPHPPKESIHQKLKLGTNLKVRFKK